MKEMMIMMMMIIIIIIKSSTYEDMKECMHYISTYARKQGYKWTKNTGMSMCQNE